MRHAARFGRRVSFLREGAQRRRLRPALLRAVDLRAVDLRAVFFFAVVFLRPVPLRAVVFFFAVVFLRAVLLRAVVFFFAVVFFRPVLLRAPAGFAAPPPAGDPPDLPPPIGDGGAGGVLDGCGAGQIDPGCFCDDQSVPVFSSCMRPPQKFISAGEELCEVSYRVRHLAASAQSF
jgi:hypothetical protein